MKIFVDTANIDEIKRVKEMGILSGVTTNPSLVAKEGKEFKDVLKEIAGIVHGPISAEVISTGVEGMIEEGKELASLSENIVVKVPMSENGLKACRILSDNGIKVNITLVFTPAQAILAARAGAAYVSPFVGRLDDIGEKGVDVVERIHKIFKLHNIKTEIIAASIRSPLSAISVAEAGADIATIPFKVIELMTKHKLTDSGLEKFLEDWDKYIKK